MMGDGAATCIKQRWCVSVCRPEMPEVLPKHVQQATKDVRSVSCLTRVQRADRSPAAFLPSDPKKQTTRRDELMWEGKVSGADSRRKQCCYATRINQ